METAVAAAEQVEERLVIRREPKRFDGRFLFTFGVAVSGERNGIDPARRETRGFETAGPRVISPPKAPPGFSRGRQRRQSLLSGALLLLALPLLAQKTDVIETTGGDRFTGEIRSYAEGRLLIAARDAGDVKIKWNRIVSINSAKLFDVEVTDGTHLLGSLQPSTPPGKLVVVEEGGAVTLDFFAVVRLAPIYLGFWRRLDGSVDLGFTYQKANSFRQFNLNAASTYRTKKFQVSTNLSAFIGEQQGATASQRGSLGFHYQAFLKNRWFLGGLVGVERNLDLGLDSRYSLGVVAGRYLKQTNRSHLAVLVGLVEIDEQPVEGDSKTSTEALIGADYSTFTYDFPEITLNARLAVSPSLSESGRVRIQADVGVRREIVADFFLSISLFDTYDSNPPTEGAHQNDWGSVLSIGYKF
jgi:Protein of unknown function, DUF481